MNKPKCLAGLLAVLIKHGVLSAEAERVKKTLRRAIVDTMTESRTDLGVPEINVVIARISDFGEKNAKGRVFPGWAAIGQDARS